MYFVCILYVGKIIYSNALFTPTIKQVLVWRPSFSNPFVRSNQSTKNKEAGTGCLKIYRKSLPRLLEL